jgi:TMEM175 potassium channel family protein
MAHPNARLEAFCDGVFAIAITLLVIDIKAPHLPAAATPAEMWEALKHILPSVYAFVLSFGIILITWVNHHQAMKAVSKSSMPFVYANGFMLLTVAFMPFPTSLLGDSLFTDHASPAVILYSLTHVMQAFAWTLFCRTSYQPVFLGVHPSDRAIAVRAERMSYAAMAFYSGCAVAAIWVPHVIAGAITMIWIVWLVYGIRIRPFAGRGADEGPLPERA